MGLNGNKKIQIKKKQEISFSQSLLNEPSMVHIQMSHGNLIKQSKQSLLYQKTLRITEGDRTNCLIMHSPDTPLPHRACLINTYFKGLWDAILIFVLELFR